MTDRKALYNGEIEKKFRFLAIASMLAVLAAHGETWYLASSQKTAVAWKGDEAGTYWTDSSGNPGSGTLNSGDTYCVRDGLTLAATHDFAGGDLWIGDPEASSYSVNELRMTAHTTHTHGFLKLLAGYVSKSSSSSANLNLASPIVVSPKAKPFGFTSSYNDSSLSIATSFEGADGTGIVLGGWYDGETMRYMAKTNVTFAVNAGLDDYHGDIKVLSDKPLTSSTRGNVTFTLPPTDSDATLEVQGGVEFKISSVGEVKLSGLTLHAQSLVTIPYDSATHTTGVVRVSGKFLIPEDEGKVRLWFETSPAVKDNKAYEFPILIVPDTQTLDVERFVVSINESVNLYERPILQVAEDKESGTKSLVAIIPGRFGLKTADSNVYTKKTAAEYATLTSAFSEEEAANWSDGKTPHEFAIYEFGMKSDWGSGHSIRTPYLRENDYTFPGLVLRTVGTSANFTLADNTKTTINLELTVNLSLRVVSSLKPTLAGTIHMGKDIMSRAYNGSELTIASTLLGNGNWMVQSAGDPAHSTIAFTADNSGWKGCLSLMQYNGTTSLADNRHMKIVVVNPSGLGGALDEFNHKAFHLADFSEVIVTNSLELAKDLNRGIYVTNTATVNVAEDCDFVCNWPITFDGPLRKVGDGTVSLGGAAKFLDSAGGLVDVPNPEVDCRLSVIGGAVKALRHDCLNGVTVELSEDTCLALDFDTANADLKRYGFYNINTDTPFAEAGEINVRIDNPDLAALFAKKSTYRLGLLTVKTSAADSLSLGSRIKFNKSGAVDGLLERVIREDDADTGLTTYSAYYDFVGFRLIVR